MKITADQLKNAKRLTAKALLPEVETEDGSEAYVIMRAVNPYDLDHAKQRYPDDAAKQGALIFVWNAIDDDGKTIYEESDVDDLATNCPQLVCRCSNVACELAKLDLRAAKKG